MIESFGDVLELGVMILMVVFAFKILYDVSVMNKEEVMKKREARYYRFYDESDVSFSDDEDEDNPYLED